MSSNIGKIAIPMFVNFMEDSDLLIFEKNLTTIEYISVIRRTTAVNMEQLDFKIFEF